MAAKGYCTYSNVEDFLGVTLTAGQQTHCNSLIEQAETFIDNWTERAWLEGAQTDEAHYLPNRLVYLRYVPVSSVTTITGRSDLGEDEETLTVDEDYEVRDLETGLIALEEPGSYDRILVDYTPVASVPADITRAATELVANWMQPSLNAGSYGVDSYTLPDLTVKFSRAHTQTMAPPTVQAILEKYRYPVHG